jgi:hypothetical protein
MTWHPGEVFTAWAKIHQALYETMKQLPRETLQFLSLRATDVIIRQSASDVLDWLGNRYALPDWGWFVPSGPERLRCQLLH